MRWRQKLFKVCPGQILVIGLERLGDVFVGQVYGAASR
jgi:hypothetical protein